MLYCLGICSTWFILSIFMFIGHSEKAGEDSQYEYSILERPRHILTYYYVLIQRGFLRVK